MRIVRAGAMPSLRDASCCSVEVVKGGVGVALTRFGLDRLDREGRRSSAFTEAPPPSPRRCRGAVELLAVRRRPAAPRKVRRPWSSRWATMRPVFARDEVLDFELAVADEAQRHRLHASGRARARQLAPQHRRQGEADEIVERAAGEIGVDQRLVDLRADAPSPPGTASLVIALKTTRSIGLVLERPSSCSGPRARARRSPRLRGQGRWRG